MRSCRTFLWITVEPYWNLNLICKVQKGYWCHNYSWTILEFKSVERLFAGNTRFITVEPYWNLNWSYSLPSKRLGGDYSWTILEFKCETWRQEVFANGDYSWTILEFKFTKRSTYKTRTRLLQLNHTGI